MSKIHEWLTAEGVGLPQDSVGTAHASATTADWFADADIGNCLKYFGQGSSDFTTLPQMPESNLSTLSMEVVFKIDGFGLTTIQEMVGWIGSPEIHLGLNNTGTLRATLWNGSSNELFESTNSYLTTGVMYTYRVTADYVGAPKRLKMYLNNVQRGLFTLTGTGCKRHNASGNNVGRLGGSTTRYFQGKIGRISMWDTVEDPTLSTASQPEGANFDDASMRTPVHMPFYGRTNGLTTLLTGWAVKNGVTNASTTVTVTPGVMAGWYDAAVRVTAAAEWDIFVRRTDTGEVWWQNLGELPETYRLDVPVITKQNDYKISDDTKKISYSGVIEVNEITRARVELPRAMEDYIVDVTPQSDARAQISVKKAVSYFEVYGNRAAVCRYTVLDITKLNKDSSRAMLDARRAAMGQNGSILQTREGQPKRPLQQI